MKISLLKDGYREIKNSFKRFLSILLMSFLGVGFFAGIRATSYDMKATLNQYYNLAKVYDVEVVSTLGLTYEDKKSLEKLEGVKEVHPGFTRDMLIKFNETSYTAKVMTYNPHINKPILDQSVENGGSMPEDSGILSWCLVDKGFVSRTDKRVGDSIELIETEDEDDRVLRVNRFRIIGVIDSPLYMSAERGNNSLGNGKTDFFIYIPPHSVKNDYYTQLYIRAKDSERYETDSSGYNRIVSTLETRIKDIKKDREESRYLSLKTEGEEKIQEAQDKLDREVKDAQAKIDDAKQEIKDADKKIKAAEEDIKEGKKKLSDGKDKLKKEKKDAYKKYDEGKDKLNTAKKELEEKLELLQTDKADLLEKKEKVETGLLELNQGIEQMRAAGMDETMIAEKTAEQKLTLEAAYDQAETGLQKIKEGETKLNEALKEVEEKIDDLPNKKSEIDRKIKDAEKKLNNHQKDIDEGEEKLKNSKEELKEAKEKLSQKENEFIERTADAEEKLDEARDKLNDLKFPKWHVFNRNDNLGYDGLIRDIKSVARLGGLFPLVLFLIAALISLNSMTRMVEEQRVQLGTLKALGYHKVDIAGKYLRYAAFACIIGGVLGMSLGFRLIPSIIWGMYKIYYSIPNDLIILFDWRNGSIGLIMAGFCVLAATVAALMKELTEVPSQLMRPKAPRLGKRVLLERVGLIWKRLSFSQKVTLRNIFRYKKRFLMTIMGVMGCTSLILSGFGLRDSVSYLVIGQYRDVFNFDMMVRLSDEAGSRARNKVREEIERMDSTELLSGVSMTSIKVTGVKEKTYDAQLIVTNDAEDLRKVIQIKDKKTRKPTEFKKNSVYITDKLAELTGVKEGDRIELMDENDKTGSFVVGGVLENYLAHYVYMNPSMYESTFRDYKMNTLILKNKNGFDEGETAAKILEMEHVDAIIFSSTVIDMMSTMMTSLNYVVAVLIIAAALLAFVVLFSLANLNISERQREISTIKVLGFYDKEVWEYLDRETILLTIIGILFGLPGGKYLNALIVKTCEVDYVRFNIELSVFSYLASAVIALLFSFFVNIITYFVLKKVNMIESLKSVE